MTVYHREQTDKEKVRSKRGKSAKRKGRRAEKWLADFLRERFGDLLGPGKLEVTQRNQGKWSGRYRPEVAIHPWGNYHDHLIHFECKRDEKRSILAAYKQAERDCAPGAIPIAVCKRSREPAIAVFRHKISDAHIEYGAQLRSSLLRATCLADDDLVPAGGLSRYPEKDIFAMWLDDYMPYLRSLLTEFLAGI